MLQDDPPPLPEMLGAQDLKEVGPGYLTSQAPGLTMHA